MKKYLVILIVLIFVSCKSRKSQYIKSHIGNTKVLSLPYGDTFITYYINDTISTLYVSHHECTECLDAYVDSGIVFIPDSVTNKILRFYKERKFIPINGKDLLLIGENKIDEELFGNQDDFMSKWHDRFLIRGKVVDVTDGGLLFYVSDYEKIYNDK